MMDEPALLMANTSQSSYQQMPHGAGMRPMRVGDPPASGILLSVPSM